MERFECLFCGTQTPVDVFHAFCSQCHEPLVFHNPPKTRRIRPNKASAVEIFKDYLPLPAVDSKLHLGEGNTPLTRLVRIGNELDYPELFVKNECSNPTGSFKDRGTVVAVQKAVSLDIRNIGTVSTGNMAASTAAYGARAGLKTIVLIKEDVSPEKLLSTGIYSPLMIRVEGDYGELTYKSFELGRKKDIYFMNSVDPFRMEGYKLVGLEIFLRLRPHAPQYIIAPVSSGGLLIGLIRAYLQLKAEGLISHMPVFIGVQAKACSPITQAFSKGALRVERVQSGFTIAQAITNPNPPGGNLLLKLLRENGGLMMDVSDEEIIAAQRMLASREGIFCLPASATVLAGFLKLAQSDPPPKKARIVLILTGTGLKNLKHLESMPMDLRRSTLEDLEEALLESLAKLPQDSSP